MNKLTSLHNITSEPIEKFVYNDTNISCLKVQHGHYYRCGLSNRTQNFANIEVLNIVIPNVIK